MKKFFSFAGGVSGFIARWGSFFDWRFFWPKERRKRYRTALLAIFLLTLFAVNLDYPKYWNKFADWANPKLDAIDMPESVQKLDNGYVLKKAEDIFNIPRFINLPFSLGLDLQGGIQLIYEADLSEITSENHKESMAGLRDVIERRVNLFGGMSCSTDSKSS